VSREIILGVVLHSRELIRDRTIYLESAICRLSRGKIFAIANSRSYGAETEISNEISDISDVVSRARGTASNLENTEDRKIAFLTSLLLSSFPCYERSYIENGQEPRSRDVRNDRSDSDHSSLIEKSSRFRSDSGMTAIFKLLSFFLSFRLEGRFCRGYIRTSYDVITSRRLFLFPF